MRPPWYERTDLVWLFFGMLSLSVAVDGFRIQKLQREVKKMSAISDRIKRYEYQKAELWKTFQAHSAAYARVLQLKRKDLVSLEEMGRAGTIEAEVDGQQFVVKCEHVCGGHYGGEWDNYLVAVCTSDRALSAECGGGTTHISVLPDDWHRKLCAELSGSPGRVELLLGHTSTEAGK